MCDSFPSKVEAKRLKRFFGVGLRNEESKPMNGSTNPYNCGESCPSRRTITRISWEQPQG